MTQNLLRQRACAGAYVRHDFFNLSHQRTYGSILSFFLSIFSFYNI